MCNSLLGRSKARKQAEAQAAAELKSAERAAQADTEAMRSNQIARETAVARDRAVDEASQFLGQPLGDVDVSLTAPASEDIDPITGRRRTTRAAFMTAQPSNTGLMI